MAIQFILGGTGSGKTTYALKQMKIRNQQNNGLEFLIVPEQFTLQAQEELMMKSDSKGLLREEVLSFNRFVYRFYEELGLANHKVMNENGKSLLIRKIIDQHLEDFVWIQLYRKKQPYMDELNTLITECYQYDLNEDLLFGMSDKVSERLLKDKLTDLGKLLKYFKNEMKENFMTNQEAMSRLIEKIPKIEALKDTTITIDSFYGFTPIQYRFIKSLMMVVKDVYICITISETENLKDLRNENELFYESKKVISKIRDIVDELHIEELPPIFLKGFERSDSQALSHLSKNLYRYPVKPFTENTTSIRLVESASIDEEIEVVALRIHQLMTQSGYRYKDIIVLASDLSLYEPKLKKTFDAFELGYFIDKKESIESTFFIQFILSSLLVVRYNFRYEHVFYHLKSLYYKQQREINKIENYCLKYGIKGIKSWKANWKEFHEDKELIMQPLFQLHEELQKDTTIEHRIKALYNYFVSLGVYDIHKELAEVKENHNNLQEATKIIKVYELVIESLDEIVQLIGREKTTLEEFVGLIETGISSIKLGQTPPSIDQILVGDLSRTRVKDNKILFVLGMNEGYVPLIKTTNQLLTDQERSLLIGLGLEVAPDQAKSLFKEQMNIYMSLLKAEKLLHISYSRSNDDMNLRPASLFFMIKKLFPKVKIEDAREIINQDHSITREGPLFERLARLASGNQFLDYEEEISKLYKYFEKSYNEREDSRLNPEIFVDGLSYSNTPKPINLLDTKAYLLSVSELETYASCPYAHYLNYRLHLAERDEYLITMPDIGILFHKCLELYIQKCVLRQLDISQIPIELRNRLIDECIDEVLEDKHNSIFTSSYRNKYLVIKLRRILKRAVWGIEEQLAKSLFRPKDVEYKFDGESNELNALVLRVSPNTSMFLRGVVDRVDEYETEDSLFISIIDYKSSKKTVDFSLIDSGVQLQLFVYLNVVKEIKENSTSKKVIPSGLYYYQIQDPFVQVDGEEEVLDTLLKQLRPNGLVLHNEEVISMFDQNIKGTSSVIPVTMTEKGISSRSSTITEEEMEITLDFVNNKSNLIGQKIYQGEIPITPFSYDQSKYCDYCKYHSICRFDPNNINEAYNEIIKDSKANIIEKMKGDRHGRGHKEDN